MTSLVIVLTGGFINVALSTGTIQAAMQAILSAVENQDAQMVLLKGDGDRIIACFKRSEFLGMYLRAVVDPLQERQIEAIEKMVNQSGDGDEWKDR